jgi:ERCC4-related helicase
MNHYQSKYWATALSLKFASNSIRGLSQSIANARVDLNPHQVRAALFALQSPLSKGVILADEVGLGKTIEAGLVIAQRWAEKKRSILLIVPAFLRKQWENELKDKFYLPSRILDSKLDDPFPSANEILICSYNYAAKNAKDLRRHWDLVVIDEAHRMRNVYKTSNKQAKAISEALQENFQGNGFKVILLTATPFQNHLMELYGLISVIDPYVFGDEETFKSQFVMPKDEELKSAALKSLRQRIDPFFIRTLRKQVREYIPFTNRIALTHEFTPSDDEDRLYQAVSAYLQKEDLAALPNSQRQLITLVLRKLLASSSFAITNTLKGMVKRLEQEAGPRHILEEMDPDQLASLDEDLKEQLTSTFPDQETRDQKEKIRQEAEELRSYLGLAEKIQRNSKGETLLIALEEAWKKAKELGAPRKAVIFTESVRTQKYLYEHLSAYGYAGQIVRINGSNNDPDSKAIYAAWLSQNPESSIGSKAVEMKTALVDHFRSSGIILLATEAAAEGVNLQFCSLVINYDLPWNPQRVEQRIGRCHRYGQKHDVVVVNFVNTRNAADQRVFELLKEKFKLFDGVFGASDEILGAIGNGIDIEMRIHQVYQTARDPEQIQAAFDALQRDLDEQIQLNLKQTSQNLLDHFDEDVTYLLKMQQEEASDTVSQRERWFRSFIAAELGNAINSHSKTIKIPGFPKLCTFDWKEAERLGIHFLREDDPFIQPLIQQAKERSLPPAELTFDYSSYRGKITLLDSLVGSTGWLDISLLDLETFEQEQQLVYAAVTDRGKVLDPEVCEKLFQLSSCVAPLSSCQLPEDTLCEIREQQKNRSLAEAESKAGSHYDKEAGKLDAWADDLKERLEKDLKDLDKDIREHRKRAAAAQSLADKIQIQQTIKSLEKERSQKRLALFQEEDRIDATRDSIIEKYSNSLRPKSSLMPILQVRFKII